MLESKSGFSGFYFYSALACLPKYTYFSGLTSSIQLATCIPNTYNESSLNPHNLTFLLHYCKENKMDVIPASENDPGLWNSSFLLLKCALFINKLGTIYKFCGGGLVCRFFLSLIIIADLKTLFDLRIVGRINGSRINLEVEKLVCKKY